MLPRHAENLERNNGKDKDSRRKVRHFTLILLCSGRGPATQTLRRALFADGLFGWLFQEAQKRYILDSKTQMD